MRLNDPCHLATNIARGKALVAAIFEARSATVADVAVGSLEHQPVNALSRGRNVLRARGATGYSAVASSSAS